MSKGKPTNMAASVHARLLELCRKTGDDANLILLRYGIERLLYRLSKSPHSKSFVLKGAMLFSIWSKQPHRPTKDLDLLGHGDPTAERLKLVFEEICVQDVADDGLVFDAKSVQVQPIREDQEYAGQRILLLAHLGKARIHLQVDVGFGDSVTPPAEQIDFPTLLEMPSPRVRSYAKETVIAEKCHAIVTLGMLNSRMKDYFDLWTLAQTFEFEGKLLGQAMKATFERRNTPWPVSVPLGLSDEFGKDAAKQKQWKAFVNKGRLRDAPGLETIVVFLREFLSPLMQDLSKVTSYDLHWAAGGPWKN